ncbi:MAG: class I SAM-dependent methyltransferase [Paenibacillus sp.]|nr:class I SAM-dependent methyltransferase [Paenibacillus sp.]
MEPTGERMVPLYHQEKEVYIEHMTRYLFASQFVKGKVILDIACGSGYGTDLLAKSGASKIYGVDISQEAVDFCLQNYKSLSTEFIVGNVIDIPLPSRSIDLVVSFETIEHVNELEQRKFLSEIKRVLKPDGGLIISTPNTLVYPKGNPYHVKELTLEEFMELLKPSFKEVKLLYQDNILSSYLFSEKNLLKKFDDLNQNETRITKINSLAPEDSMYFIALCGDGFNDEIKESVLLFNLKPEKKYSAYEKTIKDLYLQIQETFYLKDRVEALSKELNSIRLSRFWKLYVVYRNLRYKYESLKRYLKPRNSE